MQSMPSVTARARSVASPEENLAALAVAHLAYRRKMPLAVYQARRLADPVESRSKRWILELEDGQVVASLVLYPLTFARDGSVVPGYGLGSVGTLPEHRGRGHASALCAAACAGAEEDGRSIGLLFSAIAPGIYERLGFRVVEAHDARCERLADLAGSGPPARLDPIDPRRHLDALVEAWRTFHRGRLHMGRDADAFRTSVDGGQDEFFLAVRGLDGGYVRVATDATTLEVQEPILLDPSDELPVLRALAGLARDHGLQALTGWLAPTAAVRDWFLPVSRDHSLPMLRGVPDVSGATFWGSDYF
jgi:ribosomal protein S18 acetylase RimI-like enzyme